MRSMMQADPARPARIERITVGVEVRMRGEAAWRRFRRIHDRSDMRRSTPLPVSRRQLLLDAEEVIVTAVPKSMLMRRMNSSQYHGGRPRILRLMDSPAE